MKSERIALVLALVTAAVSRLSGARTLVRDDRILLPGADPWYHWRSALWTARNGALLGYDAWTGFPAGANPGQFGTVHDVLLAAVALVGGLGDAEAGMWLAAAVPVAFSLVAVALVYIYAHGYGRIEAAAAPVALAMFSGIFYARGRYGFIDHHMTEVVLLLLVLILVDRAATGASARSVIAAGGVLALYIHTWPPGVFMVPALVATAAWHGLQDDENEVWAIGTTLLIAGACLSSVVVSGAHLTTVSELHALVLVLSGMYCMLLFAGAGMPWSPLLRIGTITTVTAVLGTAAIMSLGMVPTATNWISIGLSGPSEAGSTIAEAKGVSLFALPGHLLSQYGLVALAALAGIPRLKDHGLRGTQVAALAVLVLVMTTAQVRMNYYLAPLLAITAAPIMADAAQRIRSATEISAGAPAVALAVAAILALPAVPLAAGAVSPGSAGDWAGTMDWMRDETPGPGGDYHGDATERPDYAVLAWWDYGHYITAMAERPAVANPFQQNAKPAALYLTAESEAGTASALDKLGSHDVRYVVVDAETATVKAHAVEAYADRKMTEESAARALYLHDGAGFPRHRLVHESWVASTLVASRPGDELRPAPLPPTAHRVEQRSTVMVYERVEGAELQLPEHADGAVVTVRTNTGRRFTWAATAGPDGLVTVPYPTTGEGATTVRAIGPYRIIDGNKTIARAEVSADSVRSGDSIEVQP